MVPRNIIIGVESILLVGPGIDLEHFIKVVLGNDAHIALCIIIMII